MERRIDASSDSTTWSSNTIEVSPLEKFFNRRMRYNATIKPYANGYVVRIGCCTLVFTDHHTMYSRLEQIYNDPETAERLYNLSCREDPPQPDPSCRRSHNTINFNPSVEEEVMKEVAERHQRAEERASLQRRSIEPCD